MIFLDERLGCFGIGVVRKVRFIFFFILEKYLPYTLDLFPLLKDLDIYLVPKSVAVYETETLQKCWLEKKKGLKIRDRFIWEKDSGKRRKS